MSEATDTTWRDERPEQTGTYWVYYPDCDSIFTIRVFLRGDGLRVATRPMDLPLEHPAFDDWRWCKLPNPPRLDQ